MTDKRPDPPLSGGATDPTAHDVRSGRLPPRGRPETPVSGGATDPTAVTRDPTVSMLTVDVLTQVLSFSDDLPTLSHQLTDTLREFTGARFVVLACVSEADEMAYTLLHVNPGRRRDLAESPTAQALFNSCRSLRDITIWGAADSPTPPPVELGDLGFVIGLAIPLRRGDTWLGVLLALGLPELQRMQLLLGSLKPLAQALGLVFHNALLLKRQETVIAQRTADLAATTNLLSQAESVAGIASWEQDLATGAVRWSPGICRLFGITGFDGHPETLGAFVHPDDRSRFVAAFQATEIATGPATFEVRLVEDTPRRTRTASITRQVRTDDRDGRRFCIGSISDVTERHEMETRLRQAEKLQAIGQLAGGVAHDFNNMLGVILGFAQLIEISAIKDETRHRARQIVVAAQRSADLTRKLLAFARKSELQFAPVDMHIVLQEASVLLERTLGKEVELLLHLDAARPVVIGDNGQLQNAVINLALNARDAMPGGGRLTVTTDNIDLPERDCQVGPFILEPGDHLRVRITDTGTGMTPDVMAHLFEPFFTTKEPGKGSGMGLASVFGTVSSHRGAIEVESRPGTGTTFSILLPVGHERAPSTSTGTTPETLVRKGHVMVVDDEPLLCTMIENMLGGAGWTVTSWQDGDAAMAWYEKHWRTVDAVILDLIMPHVGGVELFRRFRHIDPRVPILLVSGHTFDTTVSELCQSGRTHILAKPFPRVELLAQLARLTEGSRTP